MKTYTNHGAQIDFSDCVHSPDQRIDEAQIDQFIDDILECLPCPNCQGDGYVDCSCGGDFCVCENLSEKPCPMCHGEGYQ